MSNALRRFSLPVLAALGLIALPRVVRAWNPLAIASPQDGQTWLTGSTRQIQWTGGDPTWNTVSLSIISGDGGRTVEAVAGGLPNNGAYNWTVNLPAGAYLAYVEGDRGLPDAQWAYGQPFLIVDSSSPASIVTIGAPPNGASVSKSVPITAAVTANIGSVAYSLDGASLGAPQTTPPYNLSWDSTQIANGTHTLVATGWDKNTGQWSTTSGPVTVTVNNVVPPSVTILTPAAGALLASSVTITAAVTGNVGAVAYTLDGAGYLTNALVTPPFTFVWDTTQVAPGTHTLTAGAWDAGTRAYLIGSTPVTVTIKQPPAPPTVTVLSPMSGASVAGFVTVTASATGNIGSVAYTLDGSGYLNAVEITPPYVYYWDTTKIGNGTHVLTAGGWDKTTGQWLAGSPPVTIAVNNPVPAPIIPIPAPGPEPGPTTVAILSPAYGAAVSSPIALTAATTGNIGCVAYTLDGSGYLDACLSAAPYQFQWDPSQVAPGTHTITAGGWDKTTGAFLVASAPVIVTVGKPAPPPPMLPSRPGQPQVAVLGTSSMSWTWSAATGAASYAVFPATDTRASIGSAATASFTDANLTPNATFSIAVAGVDAAGLGALSLPSPTTVYTFANPPGGVTAGAVHVTSAAISWSLNGNPASTVAQAQRSTDNVNFALIATSSTTSLADSGLANCSTYYYRVRNQNGNGVLTIFTKTLTILTSCFTSVRAAIKVPDAGKRVAGNRVTVIAELISGSSGEMSQVAFEYRLAGAPRWTLIPAANINHPNPIASPPYLVQWDTTLLAPGSYELRAVASDLSGLADPAPPSVAINVAAPGDPNFDISENVDSADGKVHKVQGLDNAVASTVHAADSGESGAVAQIVVPAGTLSSSKAAITAVCNPDISTRVPAGLQLVGSAVQLSLSNGQHELNAPVTMTLSYPEGVDPAGLKIISLKEGSDRWLQDVVSTVDAAKRTITGQTTHFSIFAVIAAGQAAADLSAIRVYPNPYRPNGSDPDQGRAFNPADLASGITFDKLPAAVTIEIYAISGRKVARFNTAASNGVVHWDATNTDGRDAASGGYFAVISSPGLSPVVKRLLIIR